MKDEEERGKKNKQRNLKEEKRNNNRKKKKNQKPQTKKRKKNKKSFPSQFRHCKCTWVFNIRVCNGNEENALSPWIFLLKFVILMELL